MYKYLVPIVIVSLLCLFPVSTASAHVLATDGSIGAILHIEPDDNPVRGTSTTYRFAFTDTAHTLDLKHCACRSEIRLDGRTISSKPIKASRPLDVTDTFTFPQAGVYTVRVSGRSDGTTSFVPFSLDYAVRVSSGSVGTQAVPTVLWLGIGSLVGLVLLAAYGLEIRYNKRDEKIVF